MYVHSMITLKYSLRKFQYAAKSVWGFYRTTFLGNDHLLVENRYFIFLKVKYMLKKYKME